MKKIVVIPTKNEEWIIELALTCHSLWADIIIVADQKSNDNTVHICKQFPKVVLINNDSDSFNEGERRQLLLNEARKYGEDLLIFALDADEIFDARVLSNDFWQNIEKKIQPGDTLEFTWIQLWGSLDTYDRRSSSERKIFAYYDNGASNFSDGRIHLSRIPEELRVNRIFIPDINVLHFQSVDLVRCRAKQRYYQVLEKQSGRLQSDFINNYIYSIHKRRPSLLPCPAFWLQAYIDKGVNFEIKNVENTFWHREIIKSVAWDIKKYALLDIWDIDWQQESERLVVNCNSNLEDPRSIIIKVYHWLQRRSVIIAALLIAGKIVTKIKNKRVTITS